MGESKDEDEERGRGRRAGGGDHEFIVSGGAVRSPGGVSDGRGGIRRMVLWPLLRNQRVREEITMGRGEDRVRMGWQEEWDGGGNMVVGMEN